MRKEKWLSGENMNIHQLSKRLETVAEYIPKHSTVADIGSDHAYLPCYAVKKGLAKAAVAGEIAEGPFQSAKKQVQSSELEHLIDVRKGDGLEVIAKGEVDCIVIAGMGGSLIASILEAGKEKLPGVSRLILQPNVGSGQVRKWLLKNGWEIVDEQILEEDAKIYEIIVAEKGDPYRPYDQLDAGILLGPILLKKKNDAFYQKWKHEYEKWGNILNQLNKAESPDKTVEKRTELMKKRNLVKEALGL
jgi:tRNA (adenine22-N1)-methyltransferase